MATPKTITQLTERSGAIQATDEIAIQVSGETTVKKKAASAITTLVIGTAAIGGNAAGDILTTNGTQTQTNKTMTSPRINTPTLNGTTAITVTGDNVNSLTNMTANVKDAIDAVVSDVADTVAMFADYAPLVNATMENLTVDTLCSLPEGTNIGDVVPTEIAFLEGATSNLQTQLNAKANLASPTFTGSSGSPVVLPTHTNIGDVGFAEIARLDGAAENIQAAITAIRAALPTEYSYTKTVSYQATVGSGATTLTLSQAAILGILGLATTDYVVDHASIVPALYEVNTGTGVMTYQDLGLSGGRNLSMSTQIINSQTQLDTMTFSGLLEKTYQISFTCKVIIKATP